MKYETGIMPMPCSHADVQEQLIALDLYSDNTKCSMGLVPSDEVDTHDNRINYIYTVYDKGANLDSTPIFAPTRAIAIRNFAAFIANLTANVAPAEFDLVLVGASLDGFFVNFPRSVVTSGDLVQPRHSQNSLPNRMEVVK